MVCESAVYFRDRNRSLRCNKSQCMSLCESNQAAGFDTEIEAEYDAATVCEELASALLIL